MFGLRYCLLVPSTYSPSLLPQYACAIVAPIEPAPPSKSFTTTLRDPVPQNVAFVRVVRLVCGLSFHLVPAYDVTTRPHKTDPDPTAIEMCQNLMLLNNVATLHLPPAAS
jgi:hypothetical protein